MSKVIDIHSHVLYGVDDGSPDEATSLGLLQMAVEHGTTDLICTPHVLDAGRSLNWGTIIQKTRELQAKAREAGININLYPGAELEMNWELTEILQKGSHDYCLAGSRYVLIELPVLMIPERMLDFIYELEVRELIPVIAHPERHQKLMAQPEVLLTWLKRGVLLQCNGGSFIGMFGHHVQMNARMLLQNHIVSFLGSDAHRLHRRNTDLTPVREELIAQSGEDVVAKLMTENPGYILEDKFYSGKVPEKLILPEPPKRSLWQKLLGRKVPD